MSRLWIYYNRDENGDCIICNEFEYNLQIWVKPRSSNPEHFKDTDEEFIDNLWRTRRPNVVRLFSDDAEFDANKLKSLIGRHIENKEKMTNFVLTSWDVIESPTIKNLLIKHMEDLSELRIQSFRVYHKEIRNYHSYYENTIPPNWSVD